MDTFLQIVFSNGVLAAGLAIILTIAERFRVNPSLLHALWLLVLFKLCTPPLVSVAIPLPWGAISYNIESTTPFPKAATGSPPTPEHPEPLPNVAIEPIVWQWLAVGIWTTGTLILAAWHVVRIVSFIRMLRHARPAPRELVGLVEKYCRQFSIASPPRLLMLPVRISPAVWSLGGRPQIILPTALVQKMDRDQMELVLAHELAHIHRRDYLVRLVELIATTLFWWNPVVWWARTHLREMEERACDALVLRSVPHGARSYAMALVETMEFLSVQNGPVPIGATAASPTVSLSRRIEMFKHASPHRLPIRGAFLAAVLFLPTMTLSLFAESPQVVELATRIYVFSDQEVAMQKAKVIQQEVSPEKWRQAGGPCSIKVTKSGSVVVAAPAQIHETIQRLLVHADQPDVGSEVSRADSNKSVDRRTWVRRVYIDLVGRLPSPEDVKSLSELANNKGEEFVIQNLVARDIDNENILNPALDGATNSELPHMLRLRNESVNGSGEPYSILVLDREEPGAALQTLQRRVDALTSDLNRLKTKLEAARSPESAQDQMKHISDLKAELKRVRHERDVLQESLSIMSRAAGN